MKRFLSFTTLAIALAACTSYKPLDTSPTMSKNSWDAYYKAYEGKLQLSIDSHDAQHLMVYMATSLQRISLKAEESGQFAAAVGAQKMLYELLLRRKMDHEAAKARRPGWGYRHGNGKA